MDFGLMRMTCLVAVFAAAAVAVNDGRWSGGYCADQNQQTDSQQTVHVCQLLNHIYTHSQHLRELKDDEEEKDDDDDDDDDDVKG